MFKANRRRPGIVPRGIYPIRDVDDLLRAQPSCINPADVTLVQEGNDAVYTTQNPQLQKAIARYYAAIGATPDGGRGVTWGGEVSRSHLRTWLECARNAGYALVNAYAAECPDPPPQPPTGPHDRDGLPRGGGGESLSVAAVAAALRELNLRCLFDFPEHFPPANLPARHRYAPPRTCDSFCIDCERRGLASTRRPYRMSHGAHTRDFEEALGTPLPERAHRPLTDLPVMFLGIEPGGDYENDEELSCQNPTGGPTIRKRVPTRHYYWTPPPDTGWPDRPDEVRSVPGPFFAYLLNRFGFRNAYFTNIVKCRLRDETCAQEVNIRPDLRHQYVDFRVRNNCVTTYLSAEYRIHLPRLVFVFGTRGMDILRDENCIPHDLLVGLPHYAVVNRNMYTIEEYTAYCESVVSAAVRRLPAM